VISNEAVDAEYLQLNLNAPEPAPSALPGQFFHLETTSDRPSNLLLRRPMSIYKADPVSGTVEFLYKVTGVGTRAMQKSAKRAPHVHSYRPTHCQLSTRSAKSKGGLPSEANPRNAG
jgi:NAD(P)H-flavin reductase